jgi:hypothetical protein
MSTLSVAVTGTAAAYDSRTECISDKGLGWSLTCALYYDEMTGTSEVVEFGETVENSEAWSTIDIYDEQLDDVWSNYNISVQNYQEILKQEGVSTYRNAILNGSTQVKARQRAVESIDNMSDPLARNIVSYSNTAMQDLGSAASSPQGSLAAGSSLDPGAANITYFDTSVTLPSGDDTINATWVGSPGTATESTYTYRGFSVYSTEYDTFVGHTGIADNDNRNKITLNAGGLGDGTFRQFEPLMNDLHNHTDDAIAEIDNLKSNTNESYFEGNATIPPSEMSKYAAENHTGYTAALLAQDGIPMSLDIKTDVMRESPSGETANYSGILGLSDALKSEPETDNLSAGDTFDVGALNGNAYFVDESGTQHTWTDGTIKIKGTDADNATLSFSEYSYDATSSYNKSLEELRAYQDALENASTYEGAYGGGIGGGLFSGGGFLPLVPWDSALIDILVLLGAGYLLVGGRRGGGTVVSS